MVDAELGIGVLFEEFTDIESESKIVKIFFDIFVTNAILIEQDKLSIYRQKSVL